MTDTMKARLDTLTRVQEYIIHTHEVLDSVIAMELCESIQSLKDEITGGELTEATKGREVVE